MCHRVERLDDKNSNKIKKTTLKNKMTKLKITSYVAYSRETIRVKKWEKTWEEGFHQIICQRITLAQRVISSHDETERLSKSDS